MESVPDRDELRRQAAVVMAKWSTDRAAMALRAAVPNDDGADRESLDSIAAEFGVSRETVRRARNQLLNDLEVAHSNPVANAFARRPTALPATPPKAAATALKRLLTMTGPLRWDEVLAAWARSKGKHPYVPLPTEIQMMKNWLLGIDGLLVEHTADAHDVPLVDVEQSEPLDRVSDFLHRTMLGRPEGIERSALFDAAEQAGLSAATIATTLSQHPAVIRVGRSTWALRGHRKHETAPLDVSHTTSTALRQNRPTRFRWDEAGHLVLEFSIPRGPSPVVAIPRAVSDLVEGRTFDVDAGGRSARLSVGRGRLWGFGPLLPILMLTPGQRVRVALDLLTGTALLTPSTTNDTERLQ